MDSGELDEAEIDVGEFVVSGGDAAKVFDLAEEAFDVAACFVEIFIVVAGDFAMPARRDDRCACLAEDLQKCLQISLQLKNCPDLIHCNN